MQDSLKINRRDDGSFEVEWDKKDPNWMFMNDLTSQEIESIVQEAIRYDQNERSRPELFSD
tara:strand:+ start:2838 stop:3020 length:183 start_codon:yes stop_codon:yes gene_type:complete